MSHDILPELELSSSRPSSTRSSESSSTRSSESEPSEKSSSEDSDIITKTDVYNDMIEIMNEVFPESEGFLINDNFKDVGLSEIEEINFLIRHITKDVDDNTYLDFTFYPGDPQDQNEPDKIRCHIYLNDINCGSNCGNISGTQMIAKMSTVFMKLKELYSTRMVIQHDVAKIKGKIGLSWLYLLTTGITWYNSKGYFGESDKKYESNKNLMLHFISMPAINLLKEELYHSSDDLLNEEIKSYIMNDPELTIKDLFLKIRRELKNPDLDAKKIDLYFGLLNTAIELFKLNNPEIYPIFINNKFHYLIFKPPQEREGEKGGRKTQKRRVIKRKNTSKRNKKSMKKRKLLKRRTKKNKK